MICSGEWRMSGRWGGEGSLRALWVTRTVLDQKVSKGWKEASLSPGYRDATEPEV